VSEWVSLDLACPNFGASSIGAEMNAQSHGSMLDSLLSTLSLLNVDGSTLQITAEFPALGATRYSATVSNGGLVTGAFTDLPFIAVTLPRACLIQAGFDTAGAIHRAFLDPVTFTVAGGGNATGDRLTLQPEDATIASPDTLVQLEAYFANTGDLLLTSAFAGLSSEVPAPVAVPALNRWGMAVLMTCLLGVAYIGERLWRHSRSHLSAR
jgi:hypothetical protein